MICFYLWSGTCKNSHKINSDRNSVGKQQATSSDNTKMMILQESTSSIEHRALHSAQGLAACPALSFAQIWTKYFWRLRDKKITAHIILRFNTLSHFLKILMYQCFAQESGMVFSSLQLHVADNRWIKSKGKSRDIFLEKKGKKKTPLE